MFILALRDAAYVGFWRIPAVERSPKNDSRRVRYRGYRDHPRTRDIRK